VDTILSASVDFVGTHFRPVIFDIGLPILDFDSDAAFDGNGFRKVEENIDIEREELQENDVVPQPSSIDDLLIPEDTEDLGGLVAKSYYGTKKIFSYQRDVFAYIVFPFSPTSNIVNVRRHIVYQTLEFIPSTPYPISYGIGFSGHSFYVDGNDYEPLASTEVYVQPELMVVTYTELPQPYYYISRTREEATDSYFNPASEQYTFDNGTNSLNNIYFTELRRGIFTETIKPDQSYKSLTTTIPLPSQLEIIIGYVPTQQSANTDYLVDLKVFDSIASLFDNLPGTSIPQFVGFSPLEVSFNLPVYDQRVEVKTNAPYTGSDRRTDGYIVSPGNTYLREYGNTTDALISDFTIPVVPQFMHEFTQEDPIKSREYVIFKLPEIEDSRLHSRFVMNQREPIHDYAQTNHPLTYRIQEPEFSNPDYQLKGFYISSLMTARYTPTINSPWMQETDDREDVEYKSFLEVKPEIRFFKGEVVYGVEPLEERVGYENNVPVDYEDSERDTQVYDKSPESNFCLNVRFILPFPISSNNKFAA